MFVGARGEKGDVEPHRDISFSCQHSEPGSREERKAGLLTLLRCIATGGRRTEGRGRTQELPAQTPQSADLRGREREDRERRRSFSEASTDSVSCQGGRARAGHTKQFGRNKSQKDGNDRSTSTTGRSIEKSEKANEEILGGKQRERGGDDVSQPPVGPLSLAYRWSHSAATAAASAHSCVNPSAMQPSTRAGGAVGEAISAQVMSELGWIRAKSRAGG